MTRSYLEEMSLGIVQFPGHLLRDNNVFSSFFFDISQGLRFIKMPKRFLQRLSGVGRRGRYVWAFIRLDEAISFWSAVLFPGNKYLMRLSHVMGHSVAEAVTLDRKSIS